MMKKEVTIEVDLLLIPKERMESFINFLAELLAEEYFKEKTLKMMESENKN